MAALKARGLVSHLEYIFGGNLDSNSFSSWSWASRNRRTQKQRRFALEPFQRWRGGSAPCGPAGDGPGVCSLAARPCYLIGPQCVFQHGRTVFLLVPTSPFALISLVLRLHVLSSFLILIVSCHCRIGTAHIALSNRQSCCCQPVLSLSLFTSLGGAGFHIPEEDTLAAQCRSSWSTSVHTRDCCSHPSVKLRDRRG
ncbi:hypothetical protein BCR34DRAFT_321904 [Clohesyomyces aquaticus]|uniref:Uncharacterized protein n=1 Tax=Clohesyomyces aquaticus TaxID=1231657 RepID=A0A1Y2A7W0_9PLEO|nr:hypothetical protein BCR34DRAFT_321904 [Clohesyomyces aquaticus]